MDTIENHLPLPFLSLIRFAGPDAADFLQGQLTNDIRILTDDGTQLAACPNAQGRVIALLRLRRSTSGIDALLPSDLAETLLRHLRRYVLRAKVSIEVPPELRCGWIAGDGPLPAGSVRFDYAVGRQVLAAPFDAWPRPGSAASAAEADRGAHDRWTAADIAAGLPQVFAATSEAYTPQMLNLDLLQAISFTKGCYTGQEIVARTQHLGRIKRRTLRYRLAGGTPPAAGQGLLRDGSKMGEVLMSAPVDGGVELLAVVSLEALGSELVLEDGRTALPVELPYGIADRG